MESLSLESFQQEKCLLARDLTADLTSCGRGQTQGWWLEVIRRIAITAHLALTARPAILME